MCKIVTEGLHRLVSSISARSDVNHLALAVTNLDHGLAFSFQDNRYPSFFCESVTEMFTATIAMQLQSEGILDLSNPIQVHLSDYELNGLNNYRQQDLSRDVTLEDLLRHTSGIPDYLRRKRLKSRAEMTEHSRIDPGWSFSDALELAKKGRSKFPPCSGRMEYSSTNYQIATEIVERASGKTFSELIENRIVKPLGLSNTRLFTLDSVPEFNSIAPVLFSRAKYLGARSIASKRGEGALVSSTSDLNVFVNALHGGHLIDPTELESMKSEMLPMRPFLSYGLGMMRVQLPKLLIGTKKAPLLYGRFSAFGSFAFIEATSNTFISGTVNQGVRPSTGFKLLTRIASHVLEAYQPGR